MAHEGGHMKEGLVASISDLFLKYGLRSTSMDDISTHLKISKKTLYQFFENKDDVVEQVMSYRIEHLRWETRPEELSKIGPVRFLYEMKKHIIANLDTLLPANYFDLRKYHPEVDKRISKERDEIMEGVLRSILSAGMESGDFRKDLDTGLQMYIFNRQMSSLIEQEVPMDPVYPVAQLISAILDNFILAVSTPKGVEEFERIRREDGIHYNRK